MSVIIETDVAKVLGQIAARYPDAIKRAGTIALNTAARAGRKFGVDQMMKEVAFPPGYLDKPGRFEISAFASESSPQVIITARSRATSLYSFAVGNPTIASTRGVRGTKGRLSNRAGGPNPGPGVSVQVKPGRILRIRGAFVIGLKAGDESGGNLGVAVRLKDRQFVNANLKKYNIDVRQLDKDYYILYGPSVAQAFGEILKEDDRNQIMSVVTSTFETELRRQFFVQLG